MFKEYGGGVLEVSGCIPPAYNSDHYTQVQGSSLRWWYLEETRLRKVEDHD